MVLKWGGNLDRAVGPFAEMFEPEGDAFVFHRGPGHAGVRVAAVERDQIVADYRKRVARLIYGSAAVAICLVALLVYLDADLDSQWWIAGLVGVMAVTMLAGTRWAMNSATDGIARRAPASAVRTREEARRIAVGRMSWTQLALTTFVIPGWIVATGNRPPEGPLDWLLLALAAASAVVGIVGAVRKLVFERRSG